MGLVGGWLSDKRKLKQAKAETRLAIEHMRAKAPIDWDKQAMINAQSSWADEWFVILLSIPAMLSFIKVSWMDGPQIVADGFTALALAPDWYLGAFGLAVAASFGYRKYADAMMKKLGK